ncbi:phosphate acyltransferase PlsX [Ectothiorhodospiraceae bacterium BW-2]|nr:phosphate acyltransferase PlsX [Ectothiorhodospiraceae bacterium BW-2]
MQKMTIAIDAMGGDFGPEVTVPAAVECCRQQPELQLLLVGDQAQIEQQLQSSRYAGSAIEVVHTSQVVTMDELPSKALRNKKDSSMRVAIDLVKTGRAKACVSAGNTGALMATSRFVLKTLAGVDRPAIITALPTISGHTHMLDLGANVDSDATILYQFALMGSVLTSAVDSIERPSIGLLNVGEEEIKGNEQVKRTHQLLQQSELNYIGYVEGDAIYRGGVDVIVADGFVGNVALKTSEGLAKMISHTMRQEFKRNWLTRLSGLAALPVLRAFRRRIDPRAYNGASLVGLNGIVIKSHGSADIFSYTTAIREAVIEIEKNVPEQIRHRLLELHAVK